MKVEIHPHALERATERGTTAEEIVDAVENGESFLVKHGRTGLEEQLSLTANGRANIFTPSRLNVML